MPTTLPFSRTRRVVGMAAALVALVAPATVSIVARTTTEAAAATTGGYWLVGTDGGIFSFGEAPFYGSTGSIPLNQPIVSMAATPSGRGYWMVASDGGLFAFGDAGFYGSMGGVPLNQPIVAMASTRTGRGYWLVAADGGIFAFGDAGFYGSMGGEHLNKPIVDMAATPTGRGYWMTATDGGVFAFGDAGFYGSTGAIDLVKRIHAMSPTPSGRGYWMVAGDGGIFAFGDAVYHGSPVEDGTAKKRILDMAVSASGQGYYLTTSEGQILNFGDAKFLGSTEDMKLNSRIAAIVANNANELPVPVDDLLSLDEDGALRFDLLKNDRDPDGGALGLRSVSKPARGTATVVGRSVLYRPSADFNGSDSFTYKVTDDRGGVSTGRAKVSVKSIDDDPSAVDDTTSVLEDIARSIPVLDNDRELGDGVRSLEITSKPENGTATVTGTRVIYKPAANFDGSDSFEYKVRDRDGDSSTGTVEAVVLPVNDVPLANNDLANTRAGKSVTVDVTENDTSVDGIRRVMLIDPATNRAVDSGSVGTTQGGIAELDGERVKFIPVAKSMVDDSFQYVIVDGEKASDPDGGNISNRATVRVRLDPNLPPRARSASAELKEVVYNDGKTYGCTDKCLADLFSDPEGDNLTISLVGAQSAEGVKVEVEPNGNVRYGPVKIQAGPDSFRVRADDGNGFSEVVTVTLTVKSPPPPPPPPTTTTTAPPPPPPAQAQGFVFLPLGSLAAALLRLRSRRRA